MTTVPVHGDELALVQLRFLRGYYGDTGPFLMPWIELQHQAAQRAKDFFRSPYTP